jgi:hypothetical protein
MKRYFAILFVALMLIGMGLSADESVLIDFAQLVADYPKDNPKENQATMVDFSVVAGSSYTAEEKALMKTSLAIQNWEVLLASSSRSVMNQALSMAKPAKVREGAANFAGATVLGVRVHFPVDPFNSWALVRPPFEIPAYMDKTVVNADGSLSVPQEEVGKGRKFDNLGVVKNVGVLKSVSMNVHGLNFPHTISLVLMDENNEEQEIFMGNLQFDGWKKLTWENPNYVAEVRNRDLRVFPLYPKSAPMRKLIGIRIYRDAAHEGGDFIGYIKDISIVYDKAVLTLERDIDDEATWGILQKREEARRTAELRRLGHLQVLRYLELKKMHAGESAPSKAPAPAGK